MVTATVAPGAEPRLYSFSPKVNVATLPGGGKSSGGKRSKMQKLARRAAWLRGPGGYVHIVPYYNTFETERLKTRLEGCQHVWLRETKGEEERWRGVGCGERDICPVCGAYRQWVLANEAVKSMELAMTGVEIGAGVALESNGIKLVLTIPKTESSRIDDLLRTDTRAWQSEVGGLFRMGYGFVKRWFGPGCGGVASIHYTGEKSPSEAHYHLNVYVFPARLDGGCWYSLGHWLEQEKIDEMRAGWCADLNKAFGLRLQDADFEFGYLGKAGKLKGWQQYLYKHSMSDLWRGWQGVDDDGQVDYWVNRQKKYEQKLTGDDLTRICERLPERWHENERLSVGLVPGHFKRIRWFGIFSDGQRAKTMEGLGLEAVEVEGDAAGDDEKWERSGDTARFVRYDPDGLVLREVERDEDGHIIHDEFEGADGWPVWRERLGLEFLVPGSKVDYRPSDVGIGKRKRWREPGGL